MFSCKVAWALSLYALASMLVFTHIILNMLCSQFLATRVVLKKETALFFCKVDLKLAGSLLALAPRLVLSQKAEFTMLTLP